MINQDVLAALLTGNAPIDTPSFILADWVMTIPRRTVYEQARAALLAREPDLDANFEVYGADLAFTDDDHEHEQWLAAGYDPPLYSTDADTGERLLLNQTFAEEHDLASNAPRQLHSIPKGLSREDAMQWLLGNVLPEEKEKQVFWSDWEGNEYDLIDGQFVPKERPCD
jgi:hypothetical protein